MSISSSVSLLLDNYFYKNNNFELDESNLNIFLNKLNQINLPIISINKNVLIKQLYFLYVIGTSLHYYNNNKLKLETSFFYKTIYYPFIFILCNNYFKQVHKFIIKLIEHSIKEILNNQQNLLHSYFFLYQNNIEILKNDVLYFFMRYSIVENNPIEIPNFNDYFSNVIRKLILYYLKIRIEGIISYKYDPLIFDEGVEMSSDRVKIYENGYNIYYIQEICKKSDTISKIMDNFSKLKSEIIDNELQIILFKYVYNSNDTHKNLLMTLYMQDNIDLNYIKDNLPIVYKLLRSIKIKNDSSLFKIQEQELIKLQIEKIIYKRFKTLYNNIDNEIMSMISKKIIDNFVLSLSNGKFIDPLTMTIITVNTKDFINQLIKFLGFIFEKDKIET